MANYRNSHDLKVEVLKKAGELQDGTSSYDTDAMIYLNSVYQGLMNGGNEFGIDVSDPWAWALSRRPIVITLLPPYATGTVTVSNNSSSCLFSAPPTFSVQGQFLKIENRDEYFMIRSHVAGDTSFTIDQPYTELGGAQQFKVIKLDYDLVDDSVVIDSSNNVLDFQETTTQLKAVLPVGLYTPAQFLGIVTAAQVAAGGVRTYNHSWDPVHRTFTWAANGAFSFLFASGANALFNPARAMGMDQKDYTLSQSYISSYPLNAINRLTAPMITYRKQDSLNAWNNSPKDEGKIFEIDYNTYVREYPMTRLNQDIPDKFAVIKNRDGIVTVRFNGFVAEASRVEIPYIPVHSDLQDSIYSIPVVPFGFREYLVHGATYYIMLDKVDDKAESEAKLAAAKLQALIHHNRKSRSLAGNNFGKLVPRRQPSRRNRTY